VVWPGANDIPVTFKQPVIVFELFSINDEPDGPESGDLRAKRARVLCKGVQWRDAIGYSGNPKRDHVEDAGAEEEESER
jgi:hypothetical protein